MSDAPAPDGTRSSPLMRLLACFFHLGRRRPKKTGVGGKVARPLGIQSGAKPRWPGGNTDNNSHPQEASYEQLDGDDRDGGHDSLVAAGVQRHGVGAVWLNV